MSRNENYPMRSNRQLHVDFVLFCSVISYDVGKGPLANWQLNISVIDLVVKILKKISADSKPPIDDIGLDFTWLAYYF